MRRDGRVAASLMFAAVLALPMWAAVDGIRDSSRDSSVVGVLVGFAFVTAALAACFFASIAFALRSSRPFPKAAIVVTGIAVAHLVAWSASRQTDTAWVFVAIYVGIGALTAAAVAPWISPGRDHDRVSVAQ